MRLITRENVKVDRVAYPWLVKKFVDPTAEFFFVPRDRVDSEARPAIDSSLRSAPPCSACGPGATPAPKQRERAARQSQA